MRHVLVFLFKLANTTRWDFRCVELFSFDQPDFFFFFNEFIYLMAAGFSCDTGSSVVIKACGIFSCDKWDPVDQLGIEPRLPPLGSAESQPLDHQGSSPDSFFNSLKQFLDLNCFKIFKPFLYCGSINLQVGKLQKKRGGLLDFAVFLPSLICQMLCELSFGALHQFSQAAITKYQSLKA